MHQTCQDALKGAVVCAGGHGWRWGTQRACGMCVGWWQHIERGLGMSEGPGHVQRNGACPGWSWATHRMLPSVGQFTWTQGWQRRRVVGVQMHVHKHGGHGWHNIMAAMKQGKDAHIGSDSEAEVGRVAVFSVWCRPHTPPWPLAYVVQYCNTSGPKKKMLSCKPE